MKKLIIISVLLFFIHQLTVAQQGWFWQNPLPQGNHLSNVSFVGNNIVYISGYGGTLLKSTDSGNNFVILETNTIENLNVNFINELTGFTPAWNGGILRTTTGGTSWEYFPMRPYYETAQIQYVSGNIVFAMCSTIVNNRHLTNIYKSTNLGNTWVLSLKPDTNTWVNSFHFADQLTGYAVGRKWGLIYSKIYRTTNGGQNWDSIASHIRTELTSPFFINANTGFVSSNILGSFILKTTNGCLNWDTINNNRVSYFNFFDALTGYGRNFGLLVTTTNGGISWRNVSSPSIPFLLNINNGIGLGGDYPRNILFKTTNSGTNWTAISKGYKNYLWDITFINENTGFAAYDYSKLLMTSNAGNSWVVINLNVPDNWSVEVIDFVNENTGYLGILWGYFGKTTNGGLNWTITQTGTASVTGISFPSVDTGYIFTKNGQHLKTTNGGANWINFGYAGAAYYGHACFINNNTGFAGGQYGFISVTRNGGTTWDSVIVDSVYWFFDVDVADDNTWFAVGYGAYNPITIGFIYRSTNAGFNWSKTRFPNSITSIHFPNSLTGYAASTGGIMYKTTNKGDNWFLTRCINAHESYGMYFINELTGWAVGGSGQIIKTTTGGGELIGIKPITNVIPKSFMLYQNYPNPFNPNTVISFQLSVNSLTQLKIYDILGREVATLVNEQLAPGTYEVDWDGSNFSSGVYFYQLTVNSHQSTIHSETKKMVLLR